MKNNDYMKIVNDMNNSNNTVLKFSKNGTYELTSLNPNDVITYQIKINNESRQVQKISDGKPVGSIYEIDPQDVPVFEERINFIESIMSSDMMSLFMNVGKRVNNHQRI